MVNRKLMAALGAAALATTLGVSAGAAHADPPGSLVGPPVHQHFIVLTDGTWIEVGPDLCENPDLRPAFNQFHHNIHHSDGTTRGPQGGAPGLHDGEGVDLIGRPGCDNN